MESKRIEIGIDLFKLMEKDVNFVDNTPEKVLRRWALKLGKLQNDHNDLKQTIENSTENSEETNSVLQNDQSSDNNRLESSQKTVNESSITKQSKIRIYTDGRPHSENESNSTDSIEKDFKLATRMLEDFEIEEDSEKPNAIHLFIDAFKILRNYINDDSAEEHGGETAKIAINTSIENLLKKLNIMILDNDGKDNFIFLFSQIQPELVDILNEKQLLRSEFQEFIQNCENQNLDSIKVIRSWAMNLGDCSKSNENEESIHDMVNHARGKLEEFDRLNDKEKPSNVQLFTDAVKILRDCNSVENLDEETSTLIENLVITYTRSLIQNLEVITPDLEGWQNLMTLFREVMVEKQQIIDSSPELKRYYLRFLKVNKPHDANKSGSEAISTTGRRRPVRVPSGSIYVSRKEVLREILKYLQKCKTPVHVRNLRKRMFEVFEKEFQQEYYRSTIDSGGERWEKLVDWAKCDGVRDGHLEKQNVAGRGFCVLTNSGKRLIL